MTGNTLRRTTTTASATVIAAALVLGASSCARNDRWCELDDGDVLVDNSFCESKVPGYEWEPDHDKPKAKKKPKKSTSKPAAPTVRAPAHR